MKSHQATEGSYAMSGEGNSLGNGLKAAWEAVSSPEFYRTALVTVAPAAVGLAATALGAPVVAVVGTQAVLGIVGAICARNDGAAASAALAGGAIAGASAATGDAVAAVVVGSVLIGNAALAVAVAAAAAKSERAGCRNPALAAAGVRWGSLISVLAMGCAGYAYAPDSLKKAPAAKAPVVSSTFSIDAKGPACEREVFKFKLENGNTVYVIEASQNCNLSPDAAGNNQPSPH